MPAFALPRPPQNRAHCSSAHDRASPSAVRDPVHAALYAAPSIYRGFTAHTAVALKRASIEERMVYKRLNSTVNVDSENNHGGSSRTYVLHRIGCSQEDDQLLRQGCERSGSPGRPDRSNATANSTIWMKTLPPALDGGHGSDHFHRAGSTIICSRTRQQVKVAHPLMLRAIAAAKKKNDRIDAEQDRRLPAL